MRSYTIFLLLAIAGLAIYFLMIRRPTKRPVSTGIRPTASTVGQLLQQIAEAHPKQSAMVRIRDGKPLPINYRELFDRVERMSLGLMMLGLSSGGRVGIIGHNAPGWIIAHLGAQLIGGVSVGIYPTNQPEACRELVDHSRVEVLVVDNRVQYEKFLPLPDSVRAVVSYSEPIEGVFYLPRLLQLVSLEQTDDDRLEYERRRDSVDPESAATFIYTSGTTGKPKAAMISHRNIISSIQMVFDAFKQQREPLIQAGEQLISYLPLNHIAAQMVDIYLAISLAATVHFADRQVWKGSLITTLRRVRPTMFIGVPRVWEKIAEGVESKLVKLRGPKKWFVRLLESWIPSLFEHRMATRLGLDRCRFRITAAAPISSAARDFFDRIGQPLFDMYGMTETAGLVTISFPEARRCGTVGRPLPGLEVRIGANDEIEVRGASVFIGYFEDPNATETVIEDGWVKTGDLGRFDHGYLKIIGRSKELIITAGGENIAPVPIEDGLKQLLPSVEHAVVIGDRRKFLSVLFTGEEPASSVETQQAIDRWNREAVSNAQRVRKWVYLPDRFTVETGELTPTLKMKRSVITEKYAETIGSLYSSLE